MTIHEFEVREALALGPDDQGRLLSAEEFAEAEFAEPWKYERVNGRLVVMSPEGKHHVRTASPWLSHLIVYKVGHPEHVQEVVPNAWVRIPDGMDRIADIGVYLGQEATTPEIPDQVPDLIFEIVSPGRESRDRDYVEKRADYHRLGVREYVIIDRFARRVTILSYSPEGYEENVLTPADTYTSPLLPGLAIPLAEVLPS
jgi:Uma2 family endonuclease